MWVPQNIYALPTQLEITLAKEAIQELENERRKVWPNLSIFDILDPPAQARLKELKREVRNYRAWIAPIRRLPPELLSDIFIIHAQLDCFAPLTDGAVCRLWRHIILSTPRAWCYIDSVRFSCIKGGLRVWIDRCASAEIHLATDWPKYEIRPAVMDYCSVVSSLTLTTENFAFSSLWYTFPKLRTLQMQGAMKPPSRGYMPPGCNYVGSVFPPFSLPSSPIDIERFPSLTCLRLDSVTTPLFSVFSASKEFPPLQKLILSNLWGFSWMELVRKCAASLRTLELSFFFLADTADITGSESIILPVLEELTYQLGVPDPYTPFGGGSEFPIMLQTPRLRWYRESQNHYSSPLHQDTQSVLELWLQANITGSFEFHVPDLSAFPSLTTIVTDFQRETAFKAVLDSLDQHPSICPKLQTIHHYPHPFERLDISTINERIVKLSPRFSSFNQAQTTKPVILYHTSLFPLKHVMFSPVVARRPQKNVVALPDPTPWFTRLMSVESADPFTCYLDDSYLY